jgi:hypothetical protein
VTRSDLLSAIAVALRWSSQNLVRWIRPGGLMKLRNSFGELHRLKQ